MGQSIGTPYEKTYGSQCGGRKHGGASGLMGGAHLYSVAKPDGLTVMILPMPGMIVSDMLEFKEVKYELEKFSYIGGWR